MTIYRHTTTGALIRVEKHPEHARGYLRITHADGRTEKVDSLWFGNHMQWSYRPVVTPAR